MKTLLDRFPKLPRAAWLFRLLCSSDARRVRTTTKVTSTTATGMKLARRAPRG